MVLGRTFDALVDDIVRFAIDLEFVVFPVAVAGVVVDAVVVGIAVVANLALVSELIVFAIDGNNGAAGGSGGSCFDGCAFVALDFLSLSFCMGIKHSLSSS